MGAATMAKACAVRGALLLALGAAYIMAALADAPESGAWTLPGINIAGLPARLPEAALIAGFAMLAGVFHLAAVGVLETVSCEICFGLQRRRQRTALTAMAAALACIPALALAVCLLADLCAINGWQIGGRAPLARCSGLLNGYTLPLLCYATMRYALMAVCSRRFAAAHRGFEGAGQGDEAGGDPKAQGDPTPVEAGVEARMGSLSRLRPGPASALSVLGAMALMCLAVTALDSLLVLLTELSRGAEEGIVAAQAGLQALGFLLLAVGLTRPRRGALCLAGSLALTGAFVTAMRGNPGSLFPFSQGIGGALSAISNILMLAMLALIAVGAALRMARLSAERLTAAGIALCALWVAAEAARVEVSFSRDDVLRYYALIRTALLGFGMLAAVWERE